MNSTGKLFHPLSRCLRGQLGDSTEGIDNDVKARARRSPLLRFFVLPPVENRRMVGGIIKQICYPRFSKEADDTYIYYLLIKHTFIVSAFLSSLYWVSSVFGVYFGFSSFKIYINPDHLLRSMMSGYSFQVPTILYLIFLPYGCLLFRANIDFNKIDLLHWNDLMLQRTGGDRNKLVVRYLLLTPLIGICAYAVWGPAALILDYHPVLADSYVLFMINLLFSTWIYSVFPFGVVTGAANFYQHWRGLGPRHNSLDMNKSIRTK